MEEDSSANCLGSSDDDANSFVCRGSAVSTIWSDGTDSKDDDDDDNES